MNIIAATSRQARTTAGFIAEASRDTWEAAYGAAILFGASLVAMGALAVFLVGMVLSPLIGINKALRQRREDRRRIVSAARKVRRGELPYQHLEEVAESRLKLFPNAKMYKQLLSISQRAKRLKKQRLLKSLKGAA